MFSRVQQNCNIKKIQPQLTQDVHTTVHPRPTAREQEIIILYSGSLASGTPVLGLSRRKMVMMRMVGTNALSNTQACLQCGQWERTGDEVVPRFPSGR